eukprot:1185662-Prorocentrum_minimum.AAC.3
MGYMYTKSLNIKNACCVCVWRKHHRHNCAAAGTLLKLLVCGMETNANAHHNPLRRPPLAPLEKIAMHSSRNDAQGVQTTQPELECVPIR